MMLSTTGAAVVLAHPLTQRGEFPLSPVFVATSAMCALAGLTYVLAVRSRSRPSKMQNAATVEHQPDAVPAGGARVAFLLTRLFGLVLLVLAIVAGRFGPDDQLSNIAPALVIGLGWPLLVVSCAVFGAVWWWINPFDTLARAVAPLGAGAGPAPEGDVQSSVWAAIPTTALWVAYLTVWPNSLSPRTISNALVVYTIITIAGCLALGRRTWLLRAEVFTVFLGWLARIRHASAGWRPPPGAAAVLGVLSGGLLYGLVRDSRLMGTFAYGTVTKTSLTLAAFAAVVALVATRAERRQQVRTGTRAVALAMIPATAALAIVLGLARNRFTTSLQLLPTLVPNILSTEPSELAGGAINTQPFGHEGLIAIQVAVLLFGAGVGVAIAVRAAATGKPTTTPMLAILPALTVLCVLLGVAVAAVTAT